MKYAARSDTGKVRTINQDAVFAADKEGAGLFLVADGMGGHSHGEKASRLIVKKLTEWWECFWPETYGGNFMQMMYSLKQMVQQANEEIYENYNRENICGSTVALLFIYNGAYGVLSAGDSRIYVYHRWKIRQITTDEVWEKQPGIAPSELQKNWKQHHGKLYNAAGIRREMQCRVVTDEWKAGMVFLICSDGLYKYCRERFLRRCMKHVQRGYHPQRMAEVLVNRVYEMGAEDNVSLILVQ